MHKHLFFNLIACLLLASPAFASSAADDSTGSDKDKSIHLFDDIYLASTERFEYYKPRVMIKEVYPILESENDNDNIETFNDLITDMLQNEATVYRARVAEAKAHQDTLPKSDIKNNLYVDFSTALINSGLEHLISVRFSIQGNITGFAHPYHYHRVLNFDLDTGEKAELQDLFKPGSNYLAVIAAYVRETLQPKLSDQNLLMSGTEPKPENYSNWNLKNNGILFTFDEATVAPYVAGTITVLVPYKALNEVLDPESLVFTCIDRTTKCKRNRILTGGFIDEAINLKYSRFNPTFA